MNFAEMLPFEEEEVMVDLLETYPNWFLELAVDPDWFLELVLDPDWFLELVVDLDWFLELTVELLVRDHVESLMVRILLNVYNNAVK